MNVDNTKKLSTVTCVEWFFGYGGNYLGLSRVIPNLFLQAVSEIETYNICNLVKKMENGLLPSVPIWSDIKTFPTKPFKDRISLFVASYPCFIGETMVLTRDGYKPIKNVQIGDEVLTHRRRWKKVTALMQKNNAPIRCIYGQGTRIRCTNEHPFLTQNKKWIEAKQLKGKRITQCLPNIKRNNIDKNIWWVIGRYLADGWRQSAPSQKKQGRVIICCNKNEANYLETKLQKAGFNAYRNEERTTTRFTITKQWFYQYLEPFGYRANGKTIPGYCFELSREKTKFLLQGYLTGDGYRYKNPKGNGGGWRSTTVSKSLAYSIALLAQRGFGVVATIREYENKSTKIIEGRVIKQQKSYFIIIPDRNRSGRVEGNFGYKLVRKSKPIGNANVFNIAVEDDESYIVNGAIVHNCQPFSSAGNQKGTEDPRHLWPHVIKWTNIVKPRWCFFENVHGHVAIGLSTVLSDLAEHGYETVWGVFSAEEAGLPHQRKRVFILAKRKDVACGEITLSENTEFPHVTQYLRQYCNIKEMGDSNSNG